MRILTEVVLTFVLNAGWQLAVIWFIAFVCARSMRGLAARFQHGVWVMALLFAILVPAWSCIEALRERTSRRSIRTDVSLTHTPATPIDISVSEPPPIQLPVESSAESAATKSFPSIHLNRTLAFALITLYGGLLLYRFAKLFSAWRRTKTIIHRAHSFAPAGAIQEIIERCGQVVNVRKVRFLYSASVSVPITAGVLKPKVILPELLLNETDHDLLTSAIGHEFVHVARHDYLLNLIYELIYLPLCFHPAARLIRANIKRTRELCCDERVAENMVNYRAYARSLIRLIRAAPFNESIATDTTIGMNESDNLEVRIMSLLNTKKAAGVRKRLCLIALAVLLMIPCVATAKLALNFDLKQQDQSVQEQQTQDRIQRQEHERVRKELKRTARQLREQIIAAQEAQRPELQQRLREVERALDEQEKVVQQAEQQLKQANEQTLQQMQEDQFVKNQAAQEAQLAEARERFAQLMSRYPEVNQQYAEEVRRAQRELEVLEEQYVQDQQQKEEKLRSKEREAREKQEWKEKEEREKQEIEEREAQEREEENRGAGLTAVKWAKIPMTQAIQIATSKYPGAVLQCRLFGEREDKVFYQVVIATGDGDNQTIKYVWVSAIDGQIFKTEETKKRIGRSGARLRTIQMPNPEYPAIARAAKVSGEVAVEITVDEQGNVIAARAVSGHPLLQAAAVSAAREAKFEPTRIDGQPVKVNGTLTYNFEPKQ